MKYYLTTCLIVLVLSGIHAQERADVIIIGDPQAYRILNRYQQPLTEKENKGLLPFSPFQIVNRNDTLGDGLTAAVRLRYRNTVYYLQKDEKDAYIVQGRPSYIKEFKGCVLRGDSIEVTRDKAILLAQKYPAEGKQRYIAKGKLVTRLFRYRNHWYVLYRDVREYFGWCSLAKRGTWKPYASLSREDYTLSAATQKRIVAKMKLINETYQKYFTEFNSLTGQGKSVPRWTCRVDSTRVTCTLSGRREYAAQLAESTKYIVRDLESILVGRPFEVVCRDGEINVRMKK